jgi:hypothetical protein
VVLEFKQVTGTDFFQLPGLFAQCHDLKQRGCTEPLLTEYGVQRLTGANRNFVPLLGYRRRCDVANVQILVGQVQADDRIGQCRFIDAVCRITFKTAQRNANHNQGDRKPQQLIRGILIVHVAKRPSKESRIPAVLKITHDA